MRFIFIKISIYLVFTFTFFSVPIASAAGSFEDGFNAGLAACPTCEKTSCPTQQCPTCEKISCPTQSCPDNTKSYVGKATELCMNDPTIDDGCAELAKTDEQVIKIITQAGKDEGKKLCKTNPTTCKIFTKPTDNTKLTINTYIENNISEFATLVNKKCITNVNSNNCGITIATSEGKNAGKEECRNNLSECFTQIGSHETIVNKDCDNKNCASAEYGKLHLPTITNYYQLLKL